MEKERGEDILIWINFYSDSQRSPMQDVKIEQTAEEWGWHRVGTALGNVCETAAQPRCSSVVFTLILGPVKSEAAPEDRARYVSVVKASWPISLQSIHAGNNPQSKMLS